MPATDQAYAGHPSLLKDPFEFEISGNDNQLSFCMCFFKFEK